MINSCCNGVLGGFIPCLSLQLVKHFLAQNGFGHEQFLPILITYDGYVMGYLKLCVSKMMWVDKWHVF